ncbi:hypothetical protein BJ138DRAFT_1021055, partial [Hygrophoropsis aurantiaca]
MQPIVLYDLESTVPGLCWSPNTARIRFALSYKGLPFTTVWVAYTDIETKLKAMNAKPTGLKSDGSDLYTLPAIDDPNTGTFMCDSLPIAIYLDKTYPTTPRFFPEHTNALTEIFSTNFYATIWPILPCMCARVSKLLDPQNTEFFSKEREAAFGIKWKDFDPADKYDENWSKFREA